MITHTGGLFSRPEYANKASLTHYTDQVSDGTIKYKFNSLGYRTAELDTYWSDRFFLALGCSYTEGVGLKNEDIWCNQLAASMKLDCMNLALSATGLDIAHAQTQQYIISNLPRPAFVIVQHSEMDRQSEVKLLPARIGISPQEPTLSWRELAHQQHGQPVLNITDMWRCSQLADAITLMWNQIGVPVIHWTFSTDGENYLTRSQVHEYPATMCPEVEMHTDLARDQVHNGPKQHQAVAKYLHAQLSQMGSSLNQPQQYANQVDSAEKALQDRIRYVILGDSTHD